ncbi:hypothetical protein COUCH_26460 [Couchioplanes caeruleus]|uniref:hypothetical protein n=1 Tax=Couchioplanes caeruleus TaxID=56438 RepID=UPI0020C150C8|nr:hypothetical protein [Couchioplanes caeruleus]UQU62559.1 hypothetical protein COUCH_26460 [Couchioplanes caeruleus]
MLGSGIRAERVPGEGWQHGPGSSRGGWFVERVTVDMAVLRTVEFWPQTGFVNAPWIEDPDEDAFVRSARGIGELYSEGIRPARVQARHSQLRLHCFAHEPGRTDVEVTVFTEPTDGFEMAGVHLPDGVAALPATARAALVLDVMHAAALRVAEARGWDPQPFEAARAHVAARDLRFRWAGPAKTAPGRQYTARPVFAITDDGLGRGVVEIRRVADGTLVSCSAEMVTAGAETVFRRAAATLHWQGSTTVRIDSEDGLCITEVVTLPRLNVRGEGANAPESTPRIVVVGGSSDAAVPDTYDTALHLLLNELSAPQWLTWWSVAPDDVLEVWYDFVVEHPARISARRAGNKLRVRIERPVTDILAAADHVMLARTDVENMLATVRRRTDLGACPELPGLEPLRTATEAQIAERLTLSRRMIALVDRLADRLPGWLVTAFRADLSTGRTGDTMSGLRVQLSEWGVELTETERVEFEALAATQR